MSDNTNMSVNKIMNLIHTKKHNQIGLINTKIGGDLNVTGTIYSSKINNGTDLIFPTTDGTDGQFLKTDGNGNLGWGTDTTGKWSDGSNSSIYNSGPIGIGKSDPEYSLDVVGSAKLSDTLYTTEAQVGYAVLKTLPGNNFTIYHRNLKDLSNGYSFWTNAFGEVKINSSGASKILFQNAGNTKMLMDYQGNLGIGTDTPLAKLDVRGSILADSDTNTTSYFGWSAIGYSGINGHASFSHSLSNTENSYSLLQNQSGQTYLNSADGKNIHFRINNSDKMILKSTGNVGIGTTNPSYELDVNGSGRISGTVHCTSVNQISDERLKEDIQATNLGLDFINELNPVSYKFKNDKHEIRQTHQGLIAQDVEKVMNNLNLSKDDNNLINYNEKDDKYGLVYTELIGPLIKSVQELTKKNRELQLRIEELEKK